MCSRAVLHLLLKFGPFFGPKKFERKKLHQPTVRLVGCSVVPFLPSSSRTLRDISWEKVIAQNRLERGMLVPRRAYRYTVCSMHIKFSVDQSAISLKSGDINSPWTMVRQKDGDLANSKWWLRGWGIWIFRCFKDRWIFKFSLDSEIWPAI